MLSFAAPKKSPLVKPVLVKALLDTLSVPQKHTPATLGVQTLQFYDPSVLDTLVTMKTPPPAAESRIGTPGKLVEPAKMPPPGPI